jgi:hypothetical protein
LRVEAALATNGNLYFGGKIRAEYERGSIHLMEIGFARSPIVFASAEVLNAGAGATALEIAVAALALILLLCIISDEDVRDTVRGLLHESVAGATAAIVDARLTASRVRSLVEQCNDKEFNPDPSPKCKERQEEFKKKDKEFKAAADEASEASRAAFLQEGTVSKEAFRFIMHRLKLALQKLERALKALRDAAMDLFNKCGCLFFV